MNIPPHIQLGDGLVADRIESSLAPILHELMSRAAKDELVVREFPATVEAYAESLESTRRRIEDLYESRPIQRLGYLVIDQDADLGIGMAYLGVRPSVRVFTPDSRIVCFDGINFSGWMLKQARSNGAMTSLADQAIGLGHQLSTSEDDQNTVWHNKLLYTGIRAGNIPSERLASHLGFQPIGVELHNTRYHAWVRPEEWEQLLPNQ